MILALATCVILLSCGYGLGCRYGYWRRDPDIIAAYGEPRWTREPLWLDLAIAVFGVALAFLSAAGLL